jgi:Protein of unknown function (DUF3593)
MFNVLHVVFRPGSCTTRWTDRSVCGATAKLHYHTILANVDWLHGLAESNLTVTNLLIGEDLSHKPMLNKNGYYLHNDKQ